MPTPPFDDDHVQRLEQEFRSGRRSRRGRRPSRGRSAPVRAGLLALGVLLLFGGFIPIAQYVDTATVPGGVTSQQAEVVRVDRIRRQGGAVGKNRGRSATVRLPDGSTDSVYLARRLDFPDAGDTLTVYREDGRLRTTAERSRLGLVGGVAAVVLIPAVGLLYVRSVRRRATRDRAARRSTPHPYAP